jgi:hypothetical protein
MENSLDTIYLIENKHDLSVYVIKVELVISISISTPLYGRKCTVDKRIG